jgi:hypothetical protein
MGTIIDKKGYVGIISDAELEERINRFGELKPCSDIQGDWNQTRYYVVFGAGFEGSNTMIDPTLLKKVEKHAGETIRDEHGFMRDNIKIFAKTTRTSQYPLVIQLKQQNYVITPVDIAKVEAYHKAHKKPVAIATDGVCKCKTHGCAHFISGDCRLKNFVLKNSKCVMKKRYHYECCPFLNSDEGQAALKKFEQERQAK